jgi:branched-subunit amino acid ABC-type transport system permease component
MVLEILLEKPLPIAAVGALLAAVCVAVFLARRNLPALLVLGVVVLLTWLLLVTERLVVTPREEVEQALLTIVSAVRANDLSQVLTQIDPQAASVRSDVELLMPLVQVEDAGATAMEVEVDTTANPQQATSRCQGRLRGVHRRSGATLFFFDTVELDWVLRDQQWLLEDFTPYKAGEPLDAVESLRGQQPRAVPSR